MDLNNVYVADIETTGFIEEINSFDDLHVLSVGYKNKAGEWQIKSTNKREEVQKFFGNPENVVVMHNGAVYDARVLKKMGIIINATIIDSLFISWALFPGLLKYGLEFFGQTYGVQKVSISDWTSLTYAQYVERCEEDVKINIFLWEDLLKKYRTLYEDEPEKIISNIKFLTEISIIAANQEDYGIKLDIAKCRIHLKILEDLAEGKIKELKEIMPKIPIKVLKRKPTTLYKKNGDLSLAGENWVMMLKQLDLPMDYDDEIEVIRGFSEPNPVSISQVKNYLHTLGWCPEIYVESINTKGEINKVEQIKDKEKNLCKSVLKLVEKEPKLIALNDLSVILHRKSYLESFLKNVREDGYITARVGGLTNTIRLKHRNLVNLPSVSAPYGEYVRSVLSCEDDEVFVGSDLSSLENYTRTHFIAPFQPEAIDILSDKEYDSHTQLAIFAGMMTENEEKFFKWFKADGKDLTKLPEEFQTLSSEDIKSKYEALGTIRQKAKTTSYSALYGIGKAKLARELKISEKEAQQLLEGYWRLNQAVKTFVETCEVKTIEGQMWVRNPLNRFWYSLRKESDIFSTVNQGCGSYLHILWCSNLRKLGIKIRGNFHDEIVTTCKSEHYEETKALLLKAIDLTNKQSRIRVPLKIDIQKGGNYGEVH